MVGASWSPLSGADQKQRVACLNGAFDPEPKKFAKRDPTKVPCKVGVSGLCEIWKQPEMPTMGPISAENHKAYVDNLRASGIQPEERLQQSRCVLSS
jgi:hypothetical protein